MRWLLLCLALGACGATQDAAGLRVRLTPEAVAALRVPLILVELPQLQVAATLVPVGRNGTVRSWRSRDGVQLSYDRGVLVATRGLGHDLMAADVSGTLSAIEGGPDTYLRPVSTVNGAFETVTITLTCTMERRGTQQYIGPGAMVTVRLMAETCKGEATFDNRYLVGPDGTIWQSRQWVTDHFGPLMTEQITP